MINISIIGIGDFSKLIIDELIKRDDVNIAYVFDNDSKKCDAIISLYFDKHQMTYTTNFDIIAQKSDVVIIDSSVKAKRGASIFFLKQNLHVVTFPPITFDYEEMLEMKEIISERNVIFYESPFIIQMEWFDKLMRFREIEEITGSFITSAFKTDQIQNLSKGVYEGEFDYEQSRGSIYTKGYDCLYLSILLFGTVKSVKSMGVKIPNDSLLSFDAIVEHKDNIYSNIKVSSQSDSPLKSVIFSEKDNFSFPNISYSTYFNVKYKYENENYTKNILDIRKALIKGITLFIEKINANDYDFFRRLFTISVETIRVLNMIEKNIDRIGEFKNEN